MIEAHPLPSPLLRLSHVLRVQSGNVWVQLSPLEEDIHFQLLPDGRLRVSAQTSTLGPGYHAHLVEALDAAAEEQDFNWVESGEDFDETGYFDRRDFDRLQSAFSEEFDGLSNLIVKKHRDLSNITVAMKPHYRPLVDDNMIATLRGPKPLSFFQAGSRGHPSGHYPWWGLEVTDATALALAEAHLWMRFPWRAPLSEQERAFGETARDLISLAQPLPAPWAKTLTEMQEVLTASAPRHPDPDGIGYLRGLMRRDVPGPWSIDVPGYYVIDVEDRGQTIILWTHDRVIWTSSLNATFPKPFDATKHLAEMEGSVRFIEDGQAYAGDFRDAATDEWPDGRLFQGQVSAPDGVAIISIEYASPDLDDAVLTAFRSVRAIRQSR